MKGASGFHGGGASPASISMVSKAPAEIAVVEKDFVGLSEATSSYLTVKEEEDEGRREEEEELELGLSLGAKKVTGINSKAGQWGEYCRILTAKDFPAMVSRASPLSSSSSVSSSATLGGGSGGVSGVAGTKRAADSVAPDVVGAGSLPSQVVVGWPPIRAFRMNSLVSQSKDNTLDPEATAHKKNNHTGKFNDGNGSKDQEKKGGHVGSSRFIKVNMDGDPIGRKMDLNAHQSYENLALALEIMFHKPTTAVTTSAYSTRSKLLDGSSEFALTYEDKEGDWMLVGDVPWGMFLDTVKRLRIMRTSDANGLAPRFRSSHLVG